MQTGTRWPRPRRGYGVSTSVVIGRDSWGEGCAPSGGPGPSENLPRPTAPDGGGTARAPESGPRVPWRPYFGTNAQ